MPFRLKNVPKRCNGGAHVVPCIVYFMQFSLQINIVFLILGNFNALRSLIKEVCRGKKIQTIIILGEKKTSLSSSIADVKGCV